MYKRLLGNIVLELETAEPSRNSPGLDFGASQSGFWKIVWYMFVYFVNSFGMILKIILETEIQTQ